MNGQWAMKYAGRSVTKGAGNARSVVMDIVAMGKKELIPDGMVTVPLAL